MAAAARVKCRVVSNTLYDTLAVAAAARVKCGVVSNTLYDTLAALWNVCCRTVLSAAYQACCDERLRNRVRGRINIL